MKILPQLKQLQLVQLLKVFVMTLFALSSGYQLFNMVHIDRLSASIENNYKDIFTTVRRFASHYNNSASHILSAGVHTVDGVSFVVRDENTDVNDIAGGLIKLKSRLDEVAPGALWSLVVLENPSTYGVFYPLRPGYETVFRSHRLHDLVTNLIERENLNNTYTEFYGCNLRMSEVYRESHTNALIRTIYFPIHNKQTLNAVISADINADYTQKLVQRYNKQNHTVLKLNGEDNLYTENGELPCATDALFTLGINYTDIIKRTLIPSALLALLIHLTVGVHRKRQRSIKLDEMTGLYRRDYFEPKFRRMDEFSMLLIDIDHFKKINDTYGHDRGDIVLRHCAQLITSQIRSDDIAVRWGGEEFIVMFKDMSPQALEDKAEQIRQLIENSEISNLSVTISIGAINAHSIPFSEAYKLADAALYQSKRRGRNKVTLA